MTARVWRRKCLRLRPGKGSFRGLACSPEVNPVPSGTAGNTVEQCQLKPCRGKLFGLWKELTFESQKRKNPLDGIYAIFLHIVLTGALNMEVRQSLKRC